MKQGVVLPALEGQLERVEEELAAIEGSAVFVRSPVMRRLLRFIVDESMAGRGAQIKSYTLAVDGLGRAEDFDAQQDSYPRVQIGRLRKALEGYYRHNSPVDGLRLELRQGSYEIHFVEVPRESGGEEIGPEARGASRGKLRHVLSGVPPWLWAVLLAFAITAALAAGGLTRHFLLPWYLGEQHSRFVKSGQMPLLDIRPVINGQPGEKDAEIASFLTFRMTDAFRRTGWVGVRTARETGEPTRFDARADFQLRSRIYRDRGALSLSLELVDLDGELILWTRDIELKPASDGSIANLEPVLAHLASAVAIPGGVIPERMLQKEQEAGRTSDYACLIEAADFKMKRSADHYRSINGCLLRALRSNPRSPKVLALLAELEQDNVDFEYAGVEPGSPERAMALAQQAVDIAPNDGMARYTLAFLQYRGGKHVLARENALKSNEADPYTSTLLTRNGNLLFFLGDRRGLELVRHALEVDPDPAPWFRQPLFFDAFANGRMAEAFAEAVAMRDIEGQGRAYLFAIRALAASMQGKKDLVRRYWARTVRIDPGAATAPHKLFLRMGVSRSYADLSVNALRAAGALGPSRPTAPPSRSGP